MYQITVILTEDRKKGRIRREKRITGESRAELQEHIPEVIKEIAKSDDFVSPMAEYIIERNGIYIDGEVDIKVKINKNGVTVKLNDLLI